MGFIAAVAETAAVAAHRRAPELPNVREVEHALHGLAVKTCDAHVDNARVGAVAIDFRRT